MSSVSIAYKTKYCYDDSLCVDKVVVKVISGKNSTTVDLSTGWGGDSPPDVRIAVNGEELDDPCRRPFENRGLLVKKVSSVFASVQGFGFRVLLDPNGRIYIYLDPFYSNKIQGLCGNMDGSAFAEFTSRSGISESVVPFAMSYSDCPSTESNVTSPSDPCSFAVQTSDYAKQQCSNVGLQRVFGECTKAIPWTRFQEICREQVCSVKASEESPIPVCTMASALAHECASYGIAVDWMSDPTFVQLCDASDVVGYSCSIEGQVFSESAPQTKYCTDLSNQAFVPTDRVAVAGCYCEKDGYLLDENDSCVPVEECSCYDREGDEYFAAGEKIQRSCGDW